VQEHVARASAPSRKEVDRKSRKPKATARRKAASQKYFDEILPRRRRQDIINHGRTCLGDIESLERHAIAWWHWKPEGSELRELVVAMGVMGRFHLSPADAAELIDEAEATAPLRTADQLARFLGVTYASRQHLKAWTLGAVDVSRAERTKRAKERSRAKQQLKRRAAGAKPQSQSVSRAKPWEQQGISRRTWYRRRQKKGHPLEVQAAVAQVCDISTKKDCLSRICATGFPVLSLSCATGGGVRR
jgi:hypothetical protein